MTRSLLLFVLAFMCFEAVSADRYWVSSSNGNWNNTSNWSTSSGGSGGASVPTLADNIYFDGNGLGNCNVDVGVTASAMQVAAAYTGVIDLDNHTFFVNGSGNNGFYGGTINNSSGTQAITVSSTGTTTFAGSTFGAIVIASSSRLFLDGSIFNNDNSFTKTGSGDDYCLGGNTFVGNVQLTNSSANFLALGNSAADHFQSNLTLNNTGSSSLIIGYQSTGNTIDGLFTINNSGAGAGTYISHIAGSSVTINGATIANNSGSGAVSNVYLASDGDVIFNASVSVSNTATATNSRVYLGNNGNIVFNNALSISNTSTGDDPNVYCNFTSSSSTVYNGDITVSCNGPSEDEFEGILFGESGSGTLAVGRTISVGAGGYSTGVLRFQNFTQTGATAQTLSLSGTGRLSIEKSEWGGDVTFSAPRLTTRTTTYHGTTSLEKTGATDDYSPGGNVFVGNTQITMSGADVMGLGSAVADTFQSNLTLTNSGISSVLVCGHNSLNNRIIGNLTVTNSGSNATTFISHLASSLTVTGRTTITNSGLGSNSNVYLGTNGTITFSGTVDVSNTAIATDSQVYLGDNGDLTFNDTLSISNMSSADDPTIHCNRNATSSNAYNGNIILACNGPDAADSKGIIFGENSGAGTLASGNTVSISAGGYSSGMLSFNNFMQSGSTSQTLTLTGSSHLWCENSGWGGNVNFTAPRIHTTTTFYSGSVFLEKTGSSGDYSSGNNTFTAATELRNSGTGVLAFGNGGADNFQDNLTLNNTGFSALSIGYNGSGSSVAGDLIINNTGTNSKVLLAVFSSSTLSVLGSTSITNNGSGSDTVSIASNGSVTFQGTVSISNAGNATASNIILGGSGDITFNDDLTIHNTSTAINPNIYLSVASTSTNAYNGNIILISNGPSSADIEGIFFGESGSGTLAATKTVSIGSGYSSGILCFKNFTQTGNTAQALTLTGTGYLMNDNANWGGNVTFTAPRINLSGSTYQGTAYIEKNGVTDDTNLGGNIFLNNVEYRNSSSAEFKTSNTSANIFSENVTYTQTGLGKLKPSYDCSTSYPKDIIVNSSDTVYIGEGTSGRAVFDGSVAQHISGSATTVQFGDLQVNNASNNITLNTPITITKELDLDRGHITSSSSNLLILADHAIVSSSSSHSFVNGPVRKIGAQVFTFPTGKSNTYAPIGISAPSSATDHFTAEYFYENPNPTYSTSNVESSIHHVSTCEYWVLDRTNGSSAVDVTLSWDTRSCTVPNDLTDLVVARWNGSQWSSHGNGGTTGSTLSGTVITLANVSSFSPFTLATTSPGATLPIELLNFNVTLQGDEVKVRWQTISETNNAYFVLQKSHDGQLWKEFAKLQGAGNSQEAQQYELADLYPYEGFTYYRLKQVDFDGSSHYSKAVMIKWLNPSSKITAYPNPITNHLSISNVSPNSIIRVVTIDGKLIFEGKEHKIDTSTWPSGIYQVTILSSIYRIKTLTIIKR